MTVTAIDRAVQKTEAVSPIGPDGGQVLTAHDENRGLGPQVSRADQQIMTARTSMLTIGEPIADFHRARLLEPVIRTEPVLHSEWNRGRTIRSIRYRAHCRKS
jgi:hypothetical protein